MKNIFIYELKCWLKDWKFYVYLLFFICGTFLIFVGTAGFFDPQPTNIKENAFLNAPYEVLKIWNFLFKGILFLIPAIIGITAYKDFKSKVHSVLFTYPINKKDYLFGKFTSGFSAVLIIVLCTTLSMLLAEHLPGLHTDKIGKLNILGYLQSVFVYILPNTLFIGLIVFSVVLYFRNIYSGFVVIIIIFLLRNILPNALEDTQLLSILDPFGEFVFEQSTSVWSRTDKNYKNIPFNYLVIANRVMWLIVSLSMFLFTYKNFELHENQNYLTVKK